jgi:hypothetical protein
MRRGGALTIRPRVPQNHLAAALVDYQATSALSHSRYSASVAASHAMFTSTATRGASGTAATATAALPLGLHWLDDMSGVDAGSGGGGWVSGWRSDSVGAEGLEMNGFTVSGSATPPRQRTTSSLTPSRQNSYSAFDSPMLRYGSFAYDGGAASPFMGTSPPPSSPLSLLGMSSSSSSSSDKVPPSFSFLFSCSFL